jgi:starch synthase (maltosyl-transferring)
LSVARATPTGVPPDGRKRVVIEAVRPEIDAGRFAIKRVPGERVVVEADVFADGHDSVACVLLWRTLGTQRWNEIEMEPLGNDRWRAAFPVERLGMYRYTVEGWVDRFRTWRKDLVKRIEAEQNVAVDLLIGADLIDAAAQRAHGEDRAQLALWAAELRGGDDLARQTLALDEQLAAMVHKYPDRSLAVRYGRELGVRVERERARFSAWYEFFPRSTA